MNAPATPPAPRLADVVFLALRPIRSLPPRHGARWIAWLRFACRHAGLPADDLILGILPFRAGRIPIDAGENLILRLILSDAGAAALPDLLDALESLPPEGEFSSATLRPVLVRDPVRGIPLDVAAGAPPIPFDASAVREEAAVLQALDRWRIRLVAPLRLPLPAGEKSRRGPDRERFCRPEFFADHPAALARLLSRVRPFPGMPPQGEAPAAGLRILAAGTAWEDMRYSAQRGIALGGVTGEIACAGAPDADSALLLAAGQHLGAGKNARFGMGFWRIPELDAVRRIPLP